MNAAAGEDIDVSVALLTYNAGPLLERLLRAVREQRTHKKVEIVAVDSGSTDGTLACLRAHGARVAEIAHADFNFGRTRDRVFEEARGSIVVNLSQDAIPAHEEWLENLVAPLDFPEIAASCGRSVPDPLRTYPQFTWERNGWFYFTREMRAYAQKHGRGLSNANAAIRREVWRELRFGDQPIGEDFRFQTKLEPTGLRIAFPDGATVLHHHTYTLRSLYKRCRNEGLGLRTLGCPYGVGDMARDIARMDLWRTWAKELYRGHLNSAAAFAFPVVRPVAVYMGSRYAKAFAQ